MPGIEPRAFCMLDEHSTNLVVVQALVFTFNQDNRHPCKQLWGLGLSLPSEHRWLDLSLVSGCFQRQAQSKRRPKDEKCLRCEVLDLSDHFQAVDRRMV